MNRDKCLRCVFAVMIVASVANVVLAQGASAEERCAEASKRSSGLHRFRREWESFEIAIADKTPGYEDCQAVSLELRWANGRNNGSNFNVTFVDAANRPIHTKQLTGFLTGNYDFPLSLTSNVESRPWLGTPWMISVPATVTVQAVRPFAPPSTIFYAVTRVPRISRYKAKSEDVVEKQNRAHSKQANEIVRIYEAVRLIGATRLSLVQVELKTSQPFPVKDVPLQLRIGKKVFVDELTGDHTGRKLTLSLTPAMFAELEDGAEVVAFFDKSEAEAWNFGKLKKSGKLSGE